MLHVDIQNIVFFYFNQKTAYEMRISDWSSDVCSSDLVKGGCDIGKAAGDFVARAAVEPCLSRDMDKLGADSVPFPFNRIVGEVDLPFFQRMGEHERPEYGRIPGGRLVGTALGPVEQRLIGWRDAVPDLLNRLHIQPERLRQRGLGKPRQTGSAH